MAKKNKRQPKRRTSARRRHSSEQEVLAPIKRSLSQISKSFCRGADRIAAILVEDSGKTKGPEAKKLKRVKKELADTVKGVGCGLKQGLKSVKPKDVLRQAVYQLGRLSKATKDTCLGMFNDLME